jgi:hypothetical protein
MTIDVGTEQLEAQICATACRLARPSRRIAGRRCRQRRCPPQAADTGLTRPDGYISFNSYFNGIGANGFSSLARA